MEERFLKARQEREEQRLGRAKEMSEVAAQRQQFDDQAATLERAVEARLQGGDVDGAQSALAELRALVLDASNSVALTAHDMAKANATLAHLQQAADEARRGTAPETAAEDAAAAPAGPGRRFKFSKKVKTTSTAPVEEGGVSVPAAAATAAAGSQGATYGPAEDTTLCVLPSRAAFVKDCRGCTVLVAPVPGSVVVSQCVDCHIYVCCHQLRMKDCRNTAVYVWCASTPIIESCDGMRFGSYEKWTGLLHSQVPVPAAEAREGGGAAPTLLVTHATHAEWVSQVGEISDLQRTRLSFQTVDDFQWLRKTASPHWRVMTDEEAKEEPARFSACDDPPSHSPSIFV